MPYMTMGYEVFHCGSPGLNDQLRAGNTLIPRLLGMHMEQGYADARGGAGTGSLWRIFVPYMIWARGLAVGASQHSATCPGRSFNVDDSFLVRNYNQILLKRIH